MLSSVVGSEAPPPVVFHSPGISPSPPSITSVRDLYFKERSVSLEGAASMISDARWFTVRSRCSIRVPGSSLKYRYSVLAKRGNEVASERLFRCRRSKQGKLSDPSCLAVLKRLSELAPDVSLFREVDGVQHGFLFFLSLTVKSSLFDIDDWNKRRCSREVDLFKKRVEAYLRPQLPEDCHVSFARVDEAHESGYFHVHMFMFVPGGLNVFPFPARHMVNGELVQKYDRHGDPLFVWRVASSLKDRRMKDELNDLWIGPDPGHEVNNVDIWAVPDLFQFLHYALKYQLKTFSISPHDERMRDWTVSLLSLYNRRGYSFSKAFTEALCSFVVDQSGDRSLRLANVTHILRKEALESFSDDSTEEALVRFEDVCSDVALRAAGCSSEELSQRVFYSERCLPSVFDNSGYERFFADDNRVVPVSVSSLFEGCSGSDCGSLEDLLSVPELFSRVHRRFLAVDVETTGSDPYSDSLVGVGIAFEGFSFYFPVGHEDGCNVSLDMLVSVLGPLFCSPAVLKVFHNAAFDVAVLERHGFDVVFPVFDTMLAAHVWDSSKCMVSLNELALNLLGFSGFTSFEDVCFGFETLASVPSARVGRYCREDVLLTLKVQGFFYRLFRSALSSDGLRDTLVLDARMLDVQLWMESSGVRFDCSGGKALSSRFEERLSVLRSEILSVVGHDFNFLSSKQVCAVLYDELGLEQSRFLTPGGVRSSSSKALKSLVSFHPLPGLLLQYRRLLKLKRDFVDSLVEKSVDGRVYTAYNLAVTSTGRLSSSSPNLQNIPKRSCVEASEIRRLFLPSDGCLFVRADYSQMELLMAAVLSQDPVLLPACRRGDDLHSLTASRLFGKPVSEVGKGSVERAVGKTCNFGLLYGLGARSFADNYNLDHPDAMISVGDAQKWIDGFFAAYPGILPYFESAVSDARLCGFSESVFGSRRWFDEKFDSGVESVEAAVVREVRNFVIQGACAVVLKRAMVNILDEFVSNGLSARLVLSVHDELVFDVPALEVPLVCGIVRRCMESAAGLSDSFPVDLEVCSSWSEALPVVPEVSGYE